MLRSRLLRAAWILEPQLHVLGSSRAFVSSLGNRAQQGGKDQQGSGQWRFMQQQGHVINPCSSLLHPAVVVDDIMPPDGEEERSVQEAYTPTSACFGCGE